ncbi:MAG: PsbP-related protein [Actinomycetota bacterium]
MKGEDLIRETMRRASGAEPPVGEAWGRFERARRRATRARTLVVVTAGAAAIAALVFTLPGVNPGAGSEPIGRGSESPSPRPRDLREYTDTFAAYRLRYPADWTQFTMDTPAGRAVMFSPDAGAPVPSIDKECAGCRPVLESPVRYYVQVRAFPGYCGRPWRQRWPEEAVSGCVPMSESVTAYMDARRTAGANVTAGKIDVAGRPTLEFVSVFPSGPMPSAARGIDYWCSGCRVIDWVFTWGQGWVLDVRAVAPDDATSANYDSEAARILASFDVPARASTR